MAVCPRCNQDRSREGIPDHDEYGEIQRCVQCHTYFQVNSPEPEPQARK
jgi:transcription elongation factor Elf1